MTDQEYIDDRLNDQINWYGKKSRINQRWFKSLRLLEIVAAAFIPFLAGIGPNILHHSITLTVIGALGVIIAISAGLSAIYRYHENWLEYRTTAETLKHEKYLYQTNCSPYDGDDAFRRLVQRVEGLISKENTQWSRSTGKAKGLPG